MVRRVIDGTSLNYYRRHGQITVDQYDAGIVSIRYGGKLD